ncbi:hypothetical protein B7494_g4812 [Chlorociboria aeruginascens]|nr:hypothetical protein B7494_g4812 [Chlorociboria aeruginascens]
MWGGTLEDRSKELPQGGQAFYEKLLAEAAAQQSPFALITERPFRAKFYTHTSLGLDLSSNSAVALRKKLLGQLTEPVVRELEQSGGGERMICEFENSKTYQPLRLFLKNLAANEKHEEMFQEVERDFEGKPAFLNADALILRHWSVNDNGDKEDLESWIHLLLNYVEVFARINSPQSKNDLTSAARTCVIPMFISRGFQSEHHILRDKCRLVVYRYPYTQFISIHSLLSATPIRLPPTALRCEFTLLLVRLTYNFIMKCPLIVTLALRAFAAVRLVQTPADGLASRTTQTDTLKDLILYTPQSLMGRIKTQNINVTPEDKSPDADTEVKRKGLDASAAVDEDETDHSGKKFTIPDL